MIVKQSKFKEFIEKYNAITNEAVALKTLKDYMFSLSGEDMLAFINYTQHSLFTDYKTQLSDSHVSENERSAIARQLTELENVLTPENESKAA